MFGNAYSFGRFWRKTAFFISPQKGTTQGKLEVSTFAMKQKNLAQSLRYDDSRTQL
jgi:hypothetical protein